MTPTVTGDITTALAALDKTSEDPAVAALEALVPGDFEAKDEKDPRKGPIVMHNNRQHGVDYRVHEGRIYQVTFHLKSSVHRNAYTNAATLIDGLPIPNAPRDDVIAKLGDPYRVLAVADRFAVDGGYLHFGWTKDGERAIVALRDR